MTDHRSLEKHSDRSCSSVSIFKDDHGST